MSIDPISFKKANEAKKLAQSVIDGEFDLGVARTEIDKKLNNLETEYAPQLNDVTAQLAQKATKGQISASDLDVSSDGSKLKLINLSDEVKQAMAGTTPITASVAKRSIDNTRYADKSITRNKTKFFKNITSNLFDKNEVDKSGYYRYTDGGFVPDTTYISSGFIPVEPSTSYVITRSGHVAYWDVAGNFISGQGGTTALTTPANAVTMTVSLDKQFLETFVAAKGLTLPAFEKPMYEDESLLVTNKNINSSLKFTRDNLDFIAKNPTINLFDKENRNKLGIYGANGEFISSGGYNASDFIPVEINARYTTTSSGYICFWDANKAFISSLSGAKSYVVPNNPTIKYATFTIDLTVLDTTMIVKGDTLPTTYIPPYDYSLSGVSASQKSPLSGMKWAVLGDSITSIAYADTPYWKVISNKHGMTAYNHGISGSRVSTVGNENPMSVRYANMQSDADIITVFGGTNDYGNTVPLGDISSVDTNTFYGALNVLCSGLIKKYPGKRIGYITPMQRYPIDRAKMKTYIAVIKEVCERYSIPVLDMYASGGLSPEVTEINTAFFSDGLHPNNAGQVVMARRIESFILSL